ncbi:hypothetical protein SAMN04488107_1263 [Geodermatophilus saharensis]|uniref:Uncharacterized protein n=1 Tax=Geodermatophilus saharensis TaxID=1137994 RepID=A0A239BLA6_9ACTN|nr:hypothetical protein [Geodermatophilus saharensis]SNS08422.1 hypothetical protein SAMN04488107_1263 [Geodermatophilus saharensis]
MTSSTTCPRPGSLRGGQLGQRLRSAIGDGAASLRRALRTSVARGTAALRHLLRRAADPVVGSGSDPVPAEGVTAAAAGAGTTGAADRRLARRLSVAVAGLMAASSVAGLTWRGLYRDAPANAATFRAYDLGSLTVATPLLAGALARARRGSPRAELLWAGMLASVVYTYAYHVFGAAFNALFLVHVALFGLAAVALVLALRSLDVAAIADRIRPRTPVRAVSAVLGLLAASLGGMWTWFSLRFAVTGAPPEEGLLLQPAPVGHLGYAMDLTTLVPGYATASVLLWRRRPWGYVLGAVLLVASAVVQVDYVLALAAQAAARIPGATAFDPQEPFIAAAITGAAAVLVAGLRPDPGTRGAAHAGPAATEARR